MKNLILGLGFILAITLTAIVRADSCFSGTCNSSDSPEAAVEVAVPDCDLYEPDAKAQAAAAQSSDVETTR